MKCFAYAQVIGSMVCHALANDSDNVAYLQLTAKMGVQSQNQASLEEASIAFSPKETEIQTRLVSMNDAVSVLEKKRGDGNGNWGDDEKKSLKTLLKVLEDDMKKWLEFEHADDKKLYEKEKATHEGCMKHINHLFDVNGDITVALGVLTSAKNKHKGCRLSERSWLDYKKLALDPDSNVDDSHVWVVHETYDGHTTMFSAMTLAEEQAQAYSDLDPVGRMRACDMDQLEYEHSFCLWRAERVYACSGLERCINQVGLKKIKEYITHRSRNRVALWQSIEKLECRITHLLKSFDVTSAKQGFQNVSDFNETDNCDSVASNPSIFQIQMEVPSHQECSSNPKILPGGDTCTQWLAKEYAWSSSTHVVPESCQKTCPAIQQPTQDFEGCTGEAADCAFYNDHPEMCGKYDTDNFKAFYGCCACGRIGEAATIAGVSVFTKTSDCDDSEGRWILFGDMTSVKQFTEDQIKSSPTNSGKTKPGSGQVGTFSFGSAKSAPYSVDVQQLDAANSGNTFDLMIEYGDKDVKTICRSGFSMTKDKTP
jgi:hypothetical protein